MEANYILDEHGEPQQEHNYDTWARWMEVHPRRLAADYFINKDMVTIYVSTLYLGTDQRRTFSLIPRPILWETMVFGGVYDLRRSRYTSLADAKAGHAKAIAKVKRETRWRLAKG